MTDGTAGEAAHLAAFAGMLIGHGLSPKPTGLTVAGQDGKPVNISCVPRRDDGERLWLCVPGAQPIWLGEADQPVIALTALKGLLNGEAP